MKRVVHFPADMKWQSLALLALPLAGAVKDHLFRKCENNPFCARNRHYAAQILPDQSFVSPYEADLNTLKIDGSQVTLDLIKTTPTKKVAMPLVIQVTDEFFHISIDERGRNLFKDSPCNVDPKRFSPAAKIILNHEFSTDSVSVSRKETKLEFTFGTNKAILHLAPLKLEIYRNDELHVALNSRQLLNIEHLRDPSATDEWGPKETDTGAWEDKYDGHTDIKLRGPESVACDVDFYGFKHVYGIPEHADSLSLRSTYGLNDTDHREPYRLFNVDIFEYLTNSSMQMYGAIPFMVSQKKNVAAGIFWLNAADSYVDIQHGRRGAHTHWMSENGVLELYIFVANKVSEIVETYGKLTGTSALPQAFAIGYHQCRWNYNSDDDVLEVNRKFDEHEIPYDVIWLDVEYTREKRYFTWNRETFKDPEGMLKELDNSKRKLVAIIDPHFKAADDNPIYKYLTDHSLVVRNSQGNPFQGHCWPGNSIWIDTLNEKALGYWSSLFAMGTDLGGYASNLHIWNDMNEPSVFSGPESTSPKDCVHFGNLEHRDIHNYYGQTVVNATYKALDARYSYTQRPYILTRSFFSGSQRLASTWTGDSMSKWEYLKIATPMILTQGLAGFPFGGADIGGFFGNPEPELLARWYQAGLFYPFFRAHAHIDSRRREPYLVQQPYYDVITAAIALRYKLLPTFYSAFYEASKSLAPVMRPLVWETPDNEDSYGIDDEFFISDSLLVKPVTDPKATEISIYLPDERPYYNYFTGAIIQGIGNHVSPVTLETIPLYVRGGTVHVRRERPRRSSELMVNDPYTLVIALDDESKAQGSFYADDGISHEHEKGKYTEVKYHYSQNKLESEIVHSCQEKFAKVPIERIIILGGRGKAAVADDGRRFDVVETSGGIIIRNPRFEVGKSWTVEVRD